MRGTESLACRVAHPSMSGKWASRRLNCSIARLSPTRSTPAGADGRSGAQDLHKTYLGGVEAVRGLWFDVGEGEIFGLLGPNGAGKSTTLGVLTTVVRPTRGHAHVAGHDVRRHPLEVQGVCDRVAIVDHGLLLADGRPSDLVDQLGPDLVELRVGADPSRAADALLASGLGSRPPLLRGDLVAMPVRATAEQLRTRVGELTSDGLGIRASTIRRSTSVQSALAGPGHRDPRCPPPLRRRRGHGPGPAGRRRTAVGHQVRRVRGCYEQAFTICS